MHGVSPNFLRVGQEKAEAAAQGQQVWQKVRCQVPCMSLSGFTGLGACMYASWVLHGVSPNYLDVGQEKVQQG